MIRRYQKKKKKKTMLNCQKRGVTEGNFGNAWAAIGELIHTQVTRLKT